MGDQNNLDVIALTITGLQVASAGAKVFNAVGGTKGLASLGLKHCSHCKGRQGPCQCKFGCPIPTKALRKTQCFPIHTGTSCNSCGSQNFPGSRFKCQTCSDFDLCQSCYEGGLHDDTHPFFHIAALGRLSEPLRPRRDTSAAPPIPAPSYNHQHHSSVSSSTSTAASLSSKPNATAAAATTSSSIPKFHHQHTGIRCDNCGTENLPGNRFKCQTCHDFDLCQSCFVNHDHDRSHAFALIATEGATPIALAKPHNGDAQTTTASPFRANAPREPQFHPSDVRHQTFTAASSTLPLAPHVNGTLREVDGPDSTPPFLTESSTSFSSSSFSTSQPHHRLHQQTADATSFLDTSSASLKAPQPSDLKPYVPPCWQNSESMNEMPKPSAAQDDIGNTASTSIPLRQNAGAPIQVLHSHVYCDGPKCRGATQCIVGRRYTCAICPPSIDLCEACYTSKSAHNISHSFKRFDQAGVSTFVTCPPQQQQLPQLQQQQIRQEQHANVFCDGPRCRGATQCIVGPRFTCATCPPSFDLCQTCYTSKAAHNASHSFKRFDKAGLTTYITCPPQMQMQQQQQTRQEQHVNVYCDGPRCTGATQCIVGPRYTCANCPPSIDLCHACYTSKAAHNTSHSFKRFDKAGLTTFVLCSPQIQMQQPQQQQTRQEQHVNVYCDGPRCLGATQCIVGPRYTCANCPPSVDLCHACFSSQSAHNMSHSFKRFDKAGLSSFVMCPPLSQEGPRPAVSHSQHANVRPGGSQVGAAPPNRPSSNAANQGGEDPSDRFQQAMEIGIEVLENEQRERERQEREAQIQELLQQNQQVALEYENARLAYQQEMLYQQQMQHQQQEAVLTEQYYDNSYQYTEEVQAYEVNVQEYEFSSDY